MSKHVPGSHEWTVEKMNELDARNRAVDEETMDRSLEELYGDAPTVAQLRTLRKTMRAEGRVTRTIHSNGVFRTDNRWISSHGATRILTKGVEEGRNSLFSDSEERLDYVSRVLIENDLSPWFNFLSLKELYALKESLIFNTTVYERAEKNDRLHGFAPDDRYVNVQKFLNWCNETGQLLPKYYRKSFFPEAPNWWKWELISSFTARQLAHLILGIEPERLEKTIEWHNQGDPLKLSETMLLLEQLIQTAIDDKKLSSNQEGKVTLRRAAEFARERKFAVSPSIDRIISSEKSVNLSKKINRTKNAGELPKTIKGELQTGGKWREYSFLFLDTEQIQITCRGLTFITDAKRLGLVKKNSPKATKAWEYFEMFAERNGEILKEEIPPYQWKAFSMQK